LWRKVQGDSLSCRSQTIRIAASGGGSSTKLLTVLTASP